MASCSCLLTSNDPDYKAKVEAITKILSVLKPDEAFFSVDEYGPFAIKMKAERNELPRREIRRSTVAEIEGWMILTAALELSRTKSPTSTHARRTRLK